MLGLIGVGVRMVEGVWGCAEPGGTHSRGWDVQRGHGCDASHPAIRSSGGGAGLRKGRGVAVRPTYACIRLTAPHV